jgi:type IV/VI secretion system ImpK/VasF family protein
MWGTLQQVPTLTGLTRDWFHFLATYRRQAKAMPPETDWVRRRLKELLERMEARAAADPGLLGAYHEVKQALVYFADEVLLSSQWAGEAAWAEKLLELEVLQTRHGGQDFFRLLQAAMDRNDAQVLAVYYKCLALGFQGKMLKQRPELAELRRNVYHRLKLGGADAARACPEAYEPLDEREFHKLPVIGTARILIGLVAALFLVVFIASKVAEARYADFLDVAKAYASSPVEEAEANR